MSTIKDSNHLLINRSGVDYKVEIQDLKSYITGPIPPPWEEKDSWTHITTEVTESWQEVRGMNHDGIYRLDGTIIAHAAGTTDLKNEPEFVITGNTAKVETYDCTSKVEYLTNLGTRTDISYMFSGLTLLVSFEPGPDWDTTNVTNMANLFYNVGAFTADVSSWDTSNVTNMSGVFYRSMWNSKSWLVTGASSWNTTNVTDMSYMLYGMEFNEDISGWDVSNVTNMSDMFSGNEVFNQDIGTWKVGNVTDMGYMFYGSTTFNQDLSKWCVSHFESMPSSFDNGSGFQGQTARQPQWGTCP